MAFGGSFVKTGRMILASRCSVKTGGTLDSSSENSLKTKGDLDPAFGYSVRILRRLSVIVRVKWLYLSTVLFHSLTDLSLPIRVDDDLMVVPFRLPTMS